MKLKDLIDGIYAGPLALHYHDLEVAGISSDSRKVDPNEIFVALRGEQFDGRQFIPSAIAHGARIIVTDDAPAGVPGEDACVLNVADTNSFLRQIAERFYGNPSRRVNVVGITGTNGKTTISYLVESILHRAQEECGVVGTVNYRVGRQVYPAVNTTPGFLENQRLLYELAEQNIRYCVMEVSSHALVQSRVDNIQFKAAVFTNLTQDHLDYHGTMENYFAAKSRLFELVREDGVCCVNVDNDYGRRLYQQLSQHVMTFGLNPRAEIHATDIRYSVRGTEFLLVTPHGEVRIVTPLLGEFNVSNILAAVCVGFHEGICLEAIHQGIEDLQCVPGRLESVESDRDYEILIDYAHTPDALRNVLAALRRVSPRRIILVFGCGGDRDRGKRPLMGRIAAAGADKIIVTSDNPRTEDPAQIIAEVESGMKGGDYEVVVDREQAIARGLNIAGEGDIVLIAGKGHEDYQVLGDRRIDFNERSVVRKVLRC
ncbi:MAG: UDP-N-acetylmuramoyl-L-alanyl-D-glutamate--2,6-diaminopimelate ligase [Candidatus Omnitrophica bacterium]|nr:UDP-N-acetylmuramoyl-L-alanyl-D-glutamate--2,6-diaminopimelate ligase [Candidatus Omnitrophota bacterium]